MSDDTNIVYFDKPIKIITHTHELDLFLAPQPPKPIARSELHYAVSEAINEREDRDGFEAFRAAALLFPEAHATGTIYVAVNRAAKIACCLHDDRSSWSKSTITQLISRSAQFGSNPTKPRMG